MTADVVAELCACIRTYGTLYMYGMDTAGTCTCTGRTYFLYGRWP